MLPLRIYSLTLPFLLTTTFMQMILSSSSLSTHWTFTQAFLTFKTLFNRSLSGWLLIFLLFTLLRLNSCSSNSKTNLPKYTNLLFTWHLTLLAILASSLTNILFSLTNFAISGLTSIRQLPVPLLPLSFTTNLTTVILSTTNSVSLNYPSPADPELSCSYCH